MDSLTMCEACVTVGRARPRRGEWHLADGAEVMLCRRCAEMLRSEMDVEVMA